MCQIALHNIIYTDGEMRLEKIVSNSQWEEVGRHISRQAEMLFGSNCKNAVFRAVFIMHILARVHR